MEDILEDDATHFVVIFIFFIFHIDSKVLTTTLTELVVPTMFVHFIGWHLIMFLVDCNRFFLRNTAAVLFNELFLFHTLSHSFFLGSFFKWKKTSEQLNTEWRRVILANFRKNEFSFIFIYFHSLRRHVHLLHLIIFSSLRTTSKRFSLKLELSWASNLEECNLVPRHKCHRKNTHFKFAVFYKSFLYENY